MIYTYWIMEFSFDIHGYLKPYRRALINVIDLEEGFVKPFDQDSTRHELFKGFQLYNQNLKDLLANRHFVQWINGSFISTEKNPADIDLVNLIDHHVVDQHESDLLRFTASEAKETFGIDAYIVKIYPQDHPFSVRTQSDVKYWEHWFSNSRKNRRRVRFPKGFIELQH